MKEKGKRKGMKSQPKCNQKKREEKSSIEVKEKGKEMSLHKSSLIMCNILNINQE